MHEVTSPQAFDGLRAEGRPVRRLDLTIATEDHNTPTLDIDKPIADLTSRTQIETLRRNAAEFGVRLHSLGDKEQGIVHVVGPQLGLTMPGITVVCGDSHTCTHGAFGAMAFGIGTSEVEHVLATQTLPLKPFKTMAITVEGELKPGVTAKDIILAVIAKIGTNGGQGYVLEFRGSAIRALSMEGRMTICNMSIEAGARAGMVAPDETTFAYLKGRAARAARARTGRMPSPTGAPCPATRAPSTTPRSSSTRTSSSRSSRGAPTPARASRCRTSCPRPTTSPTPTSAPPPSGRSSTWTCEPGTPLKDVAVDAVFMGSCTNSRIEDLRAFASIVKGRKKAEGVRVMVVPGLRPRAARGRGRGPRQGLHRLRRRVAVRRLLDVPRHEPRPARPGRALRVDVATATSRAGRARAVARTSCRRWSPRRPRCAARCRARANSARFDAQDRRRWRPDMEKFTTHTGIAAPLKRSAVDTDQIIPAVYLKRVTKTGFEDALFASWRQDPEFVLNQPAYRSGASILVAGPDFGTGSSREHAVWALRDFGFRVVLSPRFADIFRGNAGKQGLLTGVVSEDDVEALWAAIEAEPGIQMTVDLEARTAVDSATLRRCLSTSTITLGGGFSRGSTTSGSRCATKTRSRSSRPAARRGGRGRFPFRKPATAPHEGADRTATLEDTVRSTG